MGAKQSTSTEETPTSNYSEVKSALLSAGISRGLARTLALNELRYHHAPEIAELAAKIKRPSQTPFPLRRNDADVSKWCRPSLDLIEASARTSKALCVNAHGAFALRAGGESEPYMALSHTWSEGLTADAEGLGLALWQVQRVFHLASGSGAEWLWIDALSVPNWAHLSPREQELARTLVNRMYDIYTNASAVLVLDALLLHLHSTHPTDVAIAALMGRWMTRVWTYQELKMAREAYFVTASGVCGYGEILDYLRTLTGLFAAGMGADGERKEKYDELRTTWRRLQRVAGRPCIADVALASQNREATVPVDQAVGFCGVLRIGLDPGQDETLEQITAKIYYSQRVWAKRMPFMHGPRLQVSPRWAPARLCGLAGGGDWEDREQQAEWDDEGLHLTCYVAKVRRIAGHEKELRDTWSYETSTYQACRVNIVFEAAGGQEGRCTVLLCQEDSADDDDAQARRDILFNPSWEDGRELWLLARSPLSKMSPGDAADQALLVFSRPGRSQFPEYDVLCSAEIVGCWGHFDMEQRRITLCD